MQKGTDISSNTIFFGKMSYQFDKKTGEVTIYGWEAGIAPSPFAGNGQAAQGVADLKNVNISSIRGEVSVAYNRVREDQVAIVGASASVGGSPNIGYTGSIIPGTWIKILTVPIGTMTLTVGNYYYVRDSNKSPGSAFQVTATLTESGSAITPDVSGTITFSSLTMGIPADYCIENSGSTGGQGFRYFIIDTSGVIWASGVSAAPGGGGPLSTLTTWTAITPHGSSLSSNDSYTDTGGVSIQIMYATDSNNKIKKDFLVTFNDGKIMAFRNDDKSGWPAVTGSDTTAWQSLNYFFHPHKSFLGNDQVIYFTDGPGIGVIQQKTGQQFDPSNSGTYNYVNANYLMAPTDAATRVTAIPNGGGLSIVVGGLMNNIYIYPSYQGSTFPGPTQLLWMPEYNTQYLLQTNNYVLIFSGNKGNVYLTNGTSVIPLITVPDYIAGSANFVQDPYFIWGGAAYTRGRVFFSIQDYNANHETANCGGVWSFVPSFSYYPQQDVGVALRLEAASSLWSTQGYNGCAPVLFVGSEATAQQANGPQFLAAWSQAVTGGSTITNSIDFSGTSPRTDGSSLIETDAVPVGTFLEKRSFNEIEVRFAAALATGESVACNYRTDLEGSWVSAGTFTSETVGTGDGSPLSWIIQGLPFEKVQIIQLQFILTSTMSSPSWCRMQQVTLR